MQTAVLSRGTLDFLESLGDAVIVIDHISRVRAWNRAAERCFGVTQETAVGSRLDDLLHFQGLSDMLAAATLKPGKDKGWRGDVVCSPPGGGIQTLDCTVSFLFADDRETGLTCLSLRPLTMVRRKSWEEDESSEAGNSVACAGDDMYRTLFATMFGAFALHEVVLDELGRPCDYVFLEINPSFETFTGLKRDDVLGRRVTELIPGIEAHWIETYGNVALTGTPVHMERYEQHLGRYFEIVAYSPAPGQFATLFMDITQRRRSEEALREYDRRFQSLLDNVHMVGMLLSDKGSVQFFNDFGVRLTGWSAAEILGRDWFDALVPEEERTGLREDLLGDLHKGDVPFHCNYNILTKAGEEKTIHWSHTILRDAHGAISGLLCMGEDITEHRRVEHDLKISEEKYRAIVENSSDVIARFDLEGRVLFLNESGHALLGVVGKEVEGKKLGELGFSELAEMLTRYVGIVCNTRQPQCVQYEATSSCGIRHFDLQAIPEFGFDGRVQSIITTARDISEIRKLETQFQQAQKMEAVGQIAAGIAHDFNNLLTAVTGGVTMAMDEVEYTGSLHAQLGDLLDHIDRGANLTKQLLAFSRKQVMDVRSLRVNDIIKAMNKILDSLVGENVKASLHLPDHVWTVRADASQIEQVLINLAVNARDAMPRGGRFVVETENVSLDDEYARHHSYVKPGDYVMIAASDTGEGISPELRERIFEPFFTTKSIGKGTGLGLASVYGIIKQHGGTIEVYSELGHGTTFKIYLPRILEPAQKLPVVQDAKVADLCGTESILILEDDESLCVMTRHILQRYGYRVMSALTGAAALELALGHEDKIDLLFTDVILPDKTGREIADILRESRPDMKILYTSGYTENSIAHHGVIDSGIHFLPKPYRPKEMVARIRQILNGME